MLRGDKAVVADSFLQEGEVGGAEFFTVAGEVAGFQTRGEVEEAVHDVEPGAGVDAAPSAWGLPEISDDPGPFGAKALGDARNERGKVFGVEAIEEEVGEEDVVRGDGEREFECVGVGQAHVWIGEQAPACLDQHAGAEVDAVDGEGWIGAGKCLREAAVAVAKDECAVFVSSGVQEDEAVVLKSRSESERFEHSVEGRDAVAIHLRPSSRSGANSGMSMATRRRSGESSGRKKSMAM